jgi:hypothetical protein
MPQKSVNFGGIRSSAFALGLDETRKRYRLQFRWIEAPPSDPSDASRKRDEHGRRRILG